MLPEFVQALLDGARAAVGAPAALLALLAVALAATQQRAAHPSSRMLVLAAFLLAAAATAMAAPSAGHAAVAAGLLAALGLRAASGAPPMRAIEATTAVAGGAAFGLASALPLALPAEVAGSLLLAAFVLALLLLIARQLAARWPQHVALRWGPRVVGAWIAAVGLLLMALQLWGRRG